MTTKNIGGPSPQTLGRYTLINRLASGGMGEIFLGATHGPAGFEKQVAIKRILPHLAAQDEFVQRFIDEAHIVVSLTHGNIVPVLDMGVADGSYFIAMEYIDGKDLRAVLQRSRALGRGPISPDLALYIGSQLCQGLAYAHRKTSEDGRALHIVHRDVSPSNVLISWEGQVKLTDFGVARALGRSLDSVTGSLRGKISYMSPEQARGEAVDHRSDIFAAGIVVWELLCGRRLFDGESDTEVLKKVQASEIPAPSELIDGIPKGVDAAVMRALAAQRSDRYPQMDDFADALERLRFSSAEPTAGPTQLSELLLELFPEQSAQPARPPSFDELLGRGPELQAAVAEHTRTLSGEERGAGSHSRDSFPATQRNGGEKSTLGWLLPLMLLGLTTGYLAAHPSGRPSGGLLVRSTPPGAMVQIAGIDMGLTPWSGHALPAQDLPIELRVVQPGWQPFRKLLEIRAGDRRVIDARLLPNTTEQDAAEPPTPVSPLLTAGPPPWQRHLPSTRPSSDASESSRPSPKSTAQQSKKGTAKRRAKRAEKTGTLFFRVKPTGLITVAGKTHRSPITGLELPAGTYSARVKHPQWQVNRRVRLRIRDGRETRKVISLKAPRKQNTSTQR